MQFRSTHSTVFAAGALLAATSCSSPVLDDRIELLGEEHPEVEPSEYHRPGQPCVLCHGKYEGADPEMSIGGTIFADAIDKVPVADVEVVLTDSVGDERRVKTNCIGNFFITVEDWEPQFPVAAAIQYPLYDAAGEVLLNPDGSSQVRAKQMDSYISRDGSCASCHGLQGRTNTSTGWVYCNAPEEENPNPFPEVPSSCPGEPVLPL